MKKISITFAAVALAGSLMAQENRASVGLEAALPMGDFGDAVGFGIGGSVGYEMPVGDNLGLMIQAGYISFAGKSIDLGPFGTIDGPSVGCIPIQVGAKYYFSENQEGVYAGLLTGIHLLSSEGSDGTTDFGVAPLLGYMVTENIDIGLRYQMLFDKQETVVVTGTSVTTESKSVTNSYLGLRIAYLF
jgi:hypothetical protein